LLALIILALFMGAYPLGKATNEAIVAVDPRESTVNLGQTFGININITGVTGLLGFDFQLSYNTTVLKLVDVEQGSFLKSVGSTFVINLTTEGNIWLAVAVYGPQPLSSANGSGVLATANFTAIAAGESLLDLHSENTSNPSELELASDPPPNSVAPIPNVAIGGNVIVSSDPANPPNPPSTSPVLTAYAVAPKTFVGQGYELPINVMTANQGDLTETFNVAVYANTTEIGEQTVTLSNGSSTIVSFVWNTNGFAYGNYTISAYALLVPGETNTASNNLTGGAVVTVTIPGDVDGNGRVNMNDIVSILKAFGSTVGQPNYNPNCDIENTGRVDMSDVVIAVSNFGQHYP
jgi:hypothetical protein